MITLTISQIARRTGVPASTLRYYERAGVLPPPTRSAAGYRQYDEQALARIAFVQRAKALGIELGDLADLVRLWDGAECSPVQDRLRALVHGQRAATRERLDELTRLASDLDAVAADIGDATCGPECACVRVPGTQHAELPLLPDGLLGASCNLSNGALRERMAAWRQLRETARTEPLPGGVKLSFASPAPVPQIADLVARESECCPFYTFTLHVEGQRCELEITAGANGSPAVRALLGIEQ